MKEIDFFEVEDKIDIFEKQLEEFKNIDIKNLDQEKLYLIAQALFLLSYMDTRRKNIENKYKELLDRVNEHNEKYYPKIEV